MSKGPFSFAVALVLYFCGGVARANVFSRYSRGEFLPLIFDLLLVNVFAISCVLTLDIYSHAGDARQDNSQPKRGIPFRERQE
jgi:hypothetical protein